MALIDVVKWNAPPDLLAWKFPSEELSTATQLIVAESQEAVLALGGQYVGPFAAGRHTLSTQNVPVLSSLVKIPFGGRSPFTAEVWFVNKVAILDVKWGTAEAIQLLDPKFRVMVRVRAAGQFGVQVEHAKKFLGKLVGTQTGFDRPQLASYFKGVMLTRAKDHIAKKLSTDGVSALEISAHLDDISQFLQSEMGKEFAEFGVRLVRFFVNSITIDEDDESIKELKMALAHRAKLDVLGTTYQQERSFDTVEGAAKNPGAGSVMGAGIGLGMGVPIGGAIGAAMNALVPNVQTSTTAAGACGKCGSKLASGAKFCPSCGGALPQTCPKCGAAMPASANFCQGCGAPKP